MSKETPIMGRPRLDIPRTRIQVLEVDLKNKKRRMKGSSKSLTVYFCNAEQAMKIIKDAFIRAEKNKS